MQDKRDKKGEDFETNDFWGFVNGDSKQDDRKVEEDDWGFDDFFVDKEEDHQEAARQQEAARREEERKAAERQQEAERQKAAQQEAARKEAEKQKAAQQEAERQAEARRAAAEKAAKAGATSRKPIISAQNEEDAPEIKEFSDTQKLSLNRLKPEIKLTSVEESIRGEEYNSEENAGDLYADRNFEYTDEEYEDGEYAYEDGEYEDGEYAYEDGEYEDGDYEYEDGEYEDGEYEYEDGEYEDGDYEYEDGEYEEEPISQGRAGASRGSSNIDDTVSRLAKTTAYDYEEDDEPERPVRSPRERSKKKSKRPMVIGIVSVLVILLLVVAVVFLLRPFGSSNPAVQESSSHYAMQKMTGVVLRVDKSSESILVYDAEAKKEQGFSLQGAGDKVLSVSSINVGDIVLVQYNPAKQNEVDSLELAGSAEELKDIQNAVPGNNSVMINGKTYSIDDKLVCLYQGQEFDVKKIGANTKYNAKAIGDHIYTIEVTSATGTLILQNVDELVGATLVLKPANGDTMELIISKDMDPIELQEGSVEVQVRKDNETIYSGKIFISAGKENTLKLTNTEEKKGKVLFVSNVDAQMTIRIEDKEYGGQEEIELPYGTYTASISAVGYDTVQQSFTVSQPYQQISVEFKENSTQVTISTSLWGVSLYVDGVYQGELEGNSITCRLTPGTHTITCTRTGYYDMAQTVTITEGMEDQMLYFSGFVMVEPEPSVPEESSAPEESSEESSMPEESSEESTEPEGSEETEVSGSGE